MSISIECIKEKRILPKWFDSATAGYYDGYIHLVGQAEYATVLKNTHYVFDLNGNIVHSLLSAPFGNRGEGLVSYLNGKMYQVGSTTIDDVWSFDPSIAGYTNASWQWVNTNFVPQIGRRVMAGGCDANGWFYIFGGWNNNTVYKTQDFVNWTSLGNLPSNINRLSSAGYCFFNNKIYVVGGVSNVTAFNTSAFYNGNVDGYVYTLDPATGTWTQIHQDKVKFGCCWGNLQTDGTYLYWVRGYVSTAQAATFNPGDGIIADYNQRGVYASLDGITWTNVSLYAQNNLGFLFERHATPNTRVGNAAYFIGGFAANDMWKFEYLT
jgi:hypothetical protein